MYDELVRKDTIDVSGLDPKISIKGLKVSYGIAAAIEIPDMAIYPGTVTSLIGPSGCGKSTLLKSINRMNETNSKSPVTTEGSIFINGKDIYQPSQDVTSLRARVGMVFQKPNPFPKSIYDNIAFGVKIHGLALTKAEIDGIVETSLQRAGLWDEVKSDLLKSGSELSGGQQQRLCIARALAVKPDILLMDEPCSALDPRSTAKIEELINQLRGTYTIVIVTHNIQQAARISDRTAFLLKEGASGRIIEEGSSSSLFVKPKDRRTESYITGRFG
ncbi:MAG: phosphate ABC transporter ATP-binding protein [Alphaproteobacteria bacterium]|nr:phosphate ABC transporter ATP-binding protein [Alphaproteobacteria bacterium]